MRNREPHGTACPTVAEAGCLTGIDSSEEMIDHARSDHPSITWTISDIETWVPDEPVDLVFSNAALHWVDDHEVLFRRLRSFLVADGVLAVQMPDNWDAPTHRIPADVLDSGEWPDAAQDGRSSATASPRRDVRPLDPARRGRHVAHDILPETHR